jgi:hypothetical protein
LHLVSAAGAKGTHLLGVLELCARCTGFALDFGFVVQVLVFAVRAVGTCGFGGLKLGAGRAKCAIVLYCGGVRLYFALLAVGTFALFGVQSVLSFVARVATALGTLSLALILAVRADFTLTIRQKSSRMAVYAVCRTLCDARGARGPAPTVARARLLFTNTILRRARIVGRVLVARASSTFSALLVGKPSIVVRVARVAFFGAVFKTLGTSRCDTAVARACVWDAFTICVFVLTIIALGAFQITVVWTIGASGRGFSRFGALAQFESTLAVLIRLHRSRLFIL